MDRVTGEPRGAPLRGRRAKPKVKIVYRGLFFHDLRRGGARAFRKLELFHSQKVGDRTRTVLYQGATAASPIH